MRSALALAAALLVASPSALAAPPPGYPWRASQPAPPAGDDLSARFAPPPGARRIDLPSGSFGDWLRHLPLLPPQSPVLLYTGALKSRQDVHAAVVDLDVGKRDLQQCADAVMRLRAEYLLAVGRGRDIRFHPDPGRPRTIAWTGGSTGASAGSIDRRRFERFLVLLFAEAGTASLAAELPRADVRKTPLVPGDVLIQGGYPGHAVLVLDAADTTDGRRLVLLGQAYMPAQQFHVLVNPTDPTRSPWYDAAALLDTAGLRTPEWRPFSAADVRRFPR